MDEIRSAGQLYSAYPARRFTAFRPELRSLDVEGRKVPHIAGFALVFDKLSRNIAPGFVERIRPGACDSSLRTADVIDQVVCRFNHNDDFLLGTIKGQTLRVSLEQREGSSGLWYDVVPPTFRNDIVELCQRGDVTQSSFAFSCPEGADEWRMSDWNVPLRDVYDMVLKDVAPVTTPAYPDATAAARSIDDAVMSLSYKFHADPGEIRSLLDAGEGVKLFRRSDRPAAPAATQIPEREEAPVAKTAAELDAEARKKLTSKERNSLPKSAFAFVDEDGVGHFPIHDAAHVRNALARIAQGAQYGKQALPKVKAAAKKFGIDTDEQNTWLDLLAEYRAEAEWFREASIDEDIRLGDAEAEERASKTNDGDSTKVATKGTDSTSKDDDEDAEADEDESGKGEEGEERSEETAGEKPEDAEAGETEERTEAEAEESAADSSADEGSPAEESPELRNAKLRAELLGKRYDPYEFSDDEQPEDSEA